MFNLMNKTKKSFTALNWNINRNKIHNCKSLQSGGSNCLQIKYTIRPSTINGIGLGIFADEFVPKGTVTWIFREEDHTIFYTKKSLQQYISKMPIHVGKLYLDKMWDWPDSNIAIYPAKDCKYVNHSDNPNNHAYGTSTHMFATRDIQKGEEIFENYNETYTMKDSFLEELYKKYNLWQPNGKHSEINKGYLQTSYAKNINLGSKRSINISLIDENGYFNGIDSHQNVKERKRYLVVEILALEEIKESDYKEMMVFKSTDCSVVVFDGIIQFTEQLCTDFTHPLLNAF